MKTGLDGDGMKMHAMIRCSSVVSIAGVLACSPSTPLQSTTAEPPPSDDSNISDHTPEPLPPPTPEICRASAVQQGEDDTCPHWVVRTYRYSGGVAPEPGTRTSWPGCVCDVCEADSECTEQADGQCRELPSPHWGDPPARVCIYPDDECYEPESCERQCMLEGSGAGSACRSMEPPPP